jgi:3alpha(or 20beta)-hydroxysteroid dehydrogenase
LAGKVALISGGARGQGEAEARMFVDRGAKVVIGDIRDEQGQAVADSLGDACRYVHLDVVSSESWAEAVAATLAAFGKLTVLVNNAGIVKTGLIEAMPEADFRAVLDINLMGCWLGMKHAIPAMKASGEPCSIVNISSVAGMKGVPGISGYVASKYAIRGMTKTAALEVGHHGIRVNSVHPGAIDTDMIRAPGFDQVDRSAVYRRNPIPRVGESDEVSELVTFLASDASSYCTGSEFIIDGGSLSGDALPIT